MNNKVKDMINKISFEVNKISPERKKELNNIATAICGHLNEQQSLNIIVICTHNSRRSQLGEVWINTLTNHFKLENIKAFSGGMEVTAFNKRMVDALTNFGFTISEIECGENPKYVFGGEEMKAHHMFSKLYNDPMNPQTDFMALMVCGHADHNCPIVKGMQYRIPLNYRDPKEYDNTDKESEVYLAKVKEIGSEMYFLFNEVNLMN